MMHPHREDEMIIKNKTWRLMEIDLLMILREYGLWQLLWGTDIFLGKIPILKTIGLVAIVLGVL